MGYKEKFEDFLDKMQGLLDNAKKQGHIIVRVEDLERTFPELREEDSKEKPNGGIVMEDFNEGNGFYKVNLNYLNKEQVEEIEGLVKKWNPELKDSEDEKVRKALIDFFYRGAENGAQTNGVCDKDILAWLEKQGEQKPPIEKLPEEMKTIGESLGFTTQEECDNYNQMVTDLIMSDDNKGELKSAVIIPKFKVGDVMRTIQEAADGIKDGMPVVVSIDEEYYHCNNELIAIKDQDNYEYPPINRRQKPATDFSDLRTWKYIVDAVWTEKEGIGQYLDNPFTEEVAKKLQKRFGNIEQKSTDKATSTTFSYITPNQKFFQWIYDRLIYVHNENPNVDYMLSLKERIEDMQNPFNYENANIQQKDFAPKAEPKFMVGNWYQCTKDFFGKGVTFNKNTAYYCAKEGCLQTEYGCHIAIVKDLYDNFKLWDISDAKDGDVLALISGQSIFLFDGYDKEYCHYSKLTNSFSPNFNYIGFIQHQFVPATKEQRNQLEKAMADAGYEWNAEKKELKKIEQKSNNNQFTPEQASVLDKHIDKFVEHNPAWSEEDEEMLENITICADKDYFICKEHIDWLKSLKERYTWKPSDEQMEALESATENCAYSEYQDCLRELIGQLKKLKG